MSLALTLIMITMTVFSCCGCAAAGSLPAETPEVQYDKQEIIDKIAYYEQRMEYATQMRVAAVGLGYTYNDDVIQLSLKEWNAANSQRAYYQNILNDILAEEALWEARMKQYPAATTVWLYLKDLEYNDYVCAGILGNMMAECGGNTLALQPTIVSPSGYYYGICQWNKGYAGVWYKDLNGQLDFLRDTIQSQFKTFGKLYKRGFTYEKFLDLRNEQDAALAFAKVYERCGSDYYHIREQNATNAYNYYTSK